MPNQAEPMAPNGPPSCVGCSPGLSEPIGFHGSTSPSSISRWMMLSGCQHRAGQRGQTVQGWYTWPCGPASKGLQRGTHAAAGEQWSKRDASGIILAPGTCCRSLTSFLIDMTELPARSQLGWSQSVRTVTNKLKKKLRNNCCSKKNPGTLHLQVAPRGTGLQHVQGTYEGEFIGRADCACPVIGLPRGSL